ncbi:MAG: biopolymer transporter ExbD [Sulfurimonas sp.]|uniref:ExbD/TolR family protein n=1 Tax=Sulfurimonas sp. TaxID=2022749 RepID=UPI0026326F1C|nr:biopolymer transporter ExbD [Sulfurimonas sp.]MDD3476753.1 biopolymer transporter ExbD [Sulfurimonas sp.]
MRVDNSYDEISEINMTPFVDIVLVILVIFMATATFVAQQKIAISLPNASKQQSQKDAKPLVLTIDKDGVIFLNDNRVENLNDELAKNSTLIAKDGVILRSDAKTSFEHVVKVIDICKQNSISKFSIQTQEASR